MQESKRRQLDIEEKRLKLKSDMERCRLQIKVDRVRDARLHKQNHFITMDPSTMTPEARVFWEQTRDIIIHSRNLKEEYNTHVEGGGTGAHADAGAGADNSVV